MRSASVRPMTLESRSRRLGHLESGIAIPLPDDTIEYISAIDVYVYRADVWSTPAATIQMLIVNSWL